MAKTDIENTIAELRSELAGLSPDQADIARHVEELIDELEAHDDATPLERVADRVRQVEVEHPRITAVLNDLMVKLSSMGI